jgi:Ser/Thr protein kinase RdoA (MazF antagonist)
VSKTGARTEFSAASTRRTLGEACSTVGLDASNARLVRIGENALYDLGSVPVIVRIARSLRVKEDVRKEMRVARWLAEAAYPAARLASIETDCDPLIVDSRYPVTFWERVDIGSGKPSSADLGRLLRRLHELSAPAWLQLPKFEPFARVEARLGSPPESVDPKCIEFLRERLQDLSARYATLQFELQFGPVHGDAHPGNLLCTTTDHVVLIDFEAFCFGPREWDLSLTAAHRYGFEWVTDAQYRDFVTAYGYDVAEWPGFPVLRAIRELTMTTWLMQMSDDSPEASAEFRRRVDDLRSGRFPRRWSAF